MSSLAGGSLSKIMIPAVGWCWQYFDAVTVPKWKPTRVTVYWSQVMLAFIMDHIHPHSGPIVIHIQFSDFPMHWCWVYGLAYFAFSELLLRPQGWPILQNTMCTSQRDAHYIDGWLVCRQISTFIWMQPTLVLFLSRVHLANIGSICMGFDELYINC